MRVTRTSFVAIAVAPFLVLTGCSGSSSGPSASDAPVSMRLYDDVGSLDPALTADGPGYQVSMFLYDRVIAVTDGEVQPYLAEKWKVSPTSVTFTIRKDAKCDDGSSLTPSAIAASMARALAPSTKSPIAPSLFEGKPTFTADNAASTFTVTTEKPSASLLLTFANPVFSVVCPAGLKDPSKLAKTGFGSGPYVLEKSVAGTSYTLKKRAGYSWGPAAYAENVDALPKTVTAKVLQNETTAANVFLRGDLDLTNSLSESAVKRMRAKKANEKPSPNAFAFLLFNQAAGPGADPTIRKAIAQAVDPKAYAAAAQGEIATPTANLMPEEATVCSQTDGAEYRPQFNVDEARKTLKAGGWKRNSDGVFEKAGKPLTLRVRSHNQEGSAGDYLSQTIKDLGAKVDTKQVELPAYIETVQKGDWDVFAATIIVQASPGTLAPTLFGPGGLDIGHVRNDAFQKAMADASSAPNFDRTCDLWKSAQDELVKNVDVVPEAHLNNIYFGNGVDYSFGYFGLIEPTTLVRK